MTWINMFPRPGSSIPVFPTLSVTLLCRLHVCLPVLAREGLTHSSVSVPVTTPGVLYLFALAKNQPNKKTKTKQTKQKTPQLPVRLLNTLQEVLHVLSAQTRERRRRVRNFFLQPHRSKLNQNTKWTGAKLSLRALKGFGFI